MRSSLKRRILRIAGYVAFAITCFVFFAYWTFPYDRLRDYIVQQVERPTGPDGRPQPSGFELDIEEFSPSWLTGAELRGVRFARISRTPAEAPFEIRAEEVNVRIGLFALLGGTTDLSFDAMIDGGTIEGEFVDAEDRTEVRAELDRVSLGSLGVLRALISLPIDGRVTGKIDVTIANEVRETRGSVDLRIAGLSVGDGETKLEVQGLNDGLSVEPISAGNLELKIVVDNGVARIDKLEGRGDDLELDGSGTIRLLKPMRMSQLDVTARIKFSDDYKDRNDVTRRLFSAMEFLPLARQARGADGSLGLRIHGSFGGRIQTAAAPGGPGAANRGRPPED